MELEREPRRPGKPHKATKPLPQGPILYQTTAKFERVSYAREVCYTLGALLLTVGLVGFVVGNLFGAHLSYAHNMIHVISGVAAIACAYLGRSIAQKFAIAFGALYLALGVLGFIFGVPADPTVGHPTRDSLLWVLSPEVLEFGVSDHIIHVLLGAAFLVSAYVGFQRRADTPEIYH